MSACVSEFKFSALLLLSVSVEVEVVVVAVVEDNRRGDATKTQLRTHKL